MAILLKKDKETRRQRSLMSSQIELSSLLVSLSSTVSLSASWSMSVLLSIGRRRRGPGAEHFGEEVLRRVRQRAVAHGVERLLDGVLDALEVDGVALDDGARGPRVAVARLADAAGVDDQFLADLQDVRLVRVADADDVGLDVFQP